MRDIQIDRVLRLKNENDRRYLLDKLTQYPNIPMSCEDVNKAITFLSDKLVDEWLTVYSGGMVGVKVAPLRSHSYDLFSDIVTLGLNLLELHGLEKFDRLVSRLNTPSHDRIATVLEVSAASNYKKAGFDLELEPPSGDKGLADFRARYFDEWIYFECKAENLEESKYYRKSTKYVTELSNEILRKATVDPAHRIDIILTRKPDNDERKKLISRIHHSVQNREFDTWKATSGIRFAINPRQTKIKLPATHVRMAQIRVGTTPIQLTQENANIQVIFNPFGSKEAQKLRRVIKEAKSQIPKGSRGIILIRTQHSRPVVDIADEKLVQPDYQNIIAILAIGNDSTWAVQNDRHQDVPLSFLQIAVHQSANSRNMN